MAENTDIKSYLGAFWSSGSGFGFNYKNVCILYSKYHIYKRLTETNAFRTIGTIELNFL